MSPRRPWCSAVRGRPEAVRHRRVSAKLRRITADRRLGPRTRGPGPPCPPPLLYDAIDQWALCVLYASAGGPPVLRPMSHCGRRFAPGHLAPGNAEYPSVSRAKLSRGDTDD